MKVIQSVISTFQDQNKGKWQITLILIMNYSSTWFFLLIENNWIRSLPAVLHPVSGPQHLNLCLNGRIACDAVVHFLRRNYDVKLTHSEEGKQFHFFNAECLLQLQTARDFFLKEYEAVLACVRSTERKSMNISVFCDCWNFHNHTCIKYDLWKVFWRNAWQLWGTVKMLSLCQ